MFVTSRKLSQAAKSVLHAVLLVVLCCLPLGLRKATAQSSTTGAIGGTVTDSAGALLPNTQVTITSVETRAVRTTKANSSGEYLVPDLQPGTYTATFTADGFQTSQENTITVTVGSLSTVSPKLAVGSVSTKVEVSDETPLMDTQNNTFSTTVDQATIDNLPINGRRWSDFALLTPGVVSEPSGYGLISFRGISYLLNNNTIDGADDNQAYYSEARGRTISSYSITQAAVQEFQVNTSNYSAQYGRSAGGVINTVTKSGSNQYHGELFFYDRDNGLGGATDPYTLLNVANGTGGYNETPYKPEDKRLQFGFGIGGPIIHDKLFWFYAYDQEHRNFPGTAVAPDANDTFAPSHATLPAGETCNLSTAPLSTGGYSTTGTFTTTALTLSAEGDYNACAIAASFSTPASGPLSFQAGSAYYQQGLGILSSYLGNVPRVQDQVINMPKLDYQINDHQHLSLLYNRFRMSSPNGFQNNQTETYGVASFGNDFVKEDFGIVHLISVLSSSVVNDALVQYSRDFEYATADQPSPNELPLANNIFGDPADIGIGYEFSEGFDIGKNEDLNRYADPDERRLQLLDGITWSHGKHVFKAGLEYNKVSDYVNNLYDGNGNYSYDYSYDFIADYLNATTGIGGPLGSSTTPGYSQLYYSYGQEFGNPVVLIATREYAGYATDDWRITPRLTLTLGVRYEYEYVPPNPVPNNGNPALAAAFTTLDPGIVTALPQTANRPDDRNNIGPRIGFAWNIFGTNDTILRGGYGLYYGRIVNSNIAQTYIESGAPNAQIGVTGYPGDCGPNFPTLATSAAQFYQCEAGSTTTGLSPITTPTFPASTVAFFNPHFQNPEVHEADLAVEQNMGHNTTFALTYMMSLGRELPSAIDSNFNPADTYDYTFTAAPAKAASTLNSYAINSATAPSVANYPLPPQSGYTVLPHGGAKLPLAPGQTFTTKVFLQAAGVTATARPNPAYGEILEVSSDVNSSYNALAVQLNRRYANGFSLLSNLTWSHALDENPYESTVVPTYNAFDPTNRRFDYGNSNLDVKLRFVGAVVYQPQTHFHGIEDAFLGGWRLAPLVRIQTGEPYSAEVADSVSGLTVPSGVDGCVPTGTATTCSVSPAYKGLNGSGSSADRLPGDRNQYFSPQTAIFDFRLGKNFNVHAPHLGSTRLEVFAELFNVMNHQNITSTGVDDEAYSLSGTTLVPYTNNQFGTYTASNNNATYTPRQLQIAARLHF